MTEVYRQCSQQAGWTGQGPPPSQRAQCSGLPCGDEVREDLCDVPIFLRIEQRPTQTLQTRNQIFSN